jgi:hypothetical protein
MEISAHWWSACRPAKKPGGPTSRVALTALGDFDAGPRTSEFLAGDALGAPLVIPAETLAVEIRATSSAGQWSGIGIRAPGSLAIDASLFPRDNDCTLLDDPDGLALGG